MDSIDRLMDSRVGINVQYGKQNKVEHKRKVTKLGGGYEIRSRDGVGKTTWRRFSVSYRAKKEKALEIESFINNTGGVDSFLFTDPVTKIGYRVVCDEGATRTDDDDMTMTVTAEFREVPA